LARITVIAKKMHRKLGVNRLALPVVALAGLLGTAVLVQAQSISIYGSIVGSVTDPSGGAVPGLRVTATNVATGIANSATTTSVGFYRIDGLITGTYKVESEGPGFKKYIKDGIALSSAQTVRVDIGLQVGDVAQTVEVTAEAPLINTESPQISSITGWETRKYLPTSNPSLFSTLGLAPGAVTGNPSFNVSFHGSRTTNYDYAINGSSFRSPFAGHIALVGNFNEWLQEQTISSVNNGAEHGTMASINATSKSGTNTFHGSAVEYYTAPGLKARNPYAGPATGITNLFATSIGGPIVRNKAFFFYSQSGQRTSNPSNQTQTVPTDAMRRGDFSAFSNRIIDPTTGAQFPGNVIPSERISPVSAALIDMFYPHANYGNTSAFAASNYRIQIPLHGRSDDIFGRVDYRFSDKHSIFTSYSFDQSFCGVGRCFAGPFLNMGYRIGYRRDQNVAISDLYSITPTLFNQFNVGWARDHNYITGSLDGAATTKAIGLQGTSPVSVHGGPAISITGVNALTVATPFQDITENIFTLRDDLSYIRGRHRLKFGAVYTHGMSAQVAFGVNNFFGNFSFNGFATGGAGRTENAFADFLLGIPLTAFRQNGQYFDRVYRLNAVGGGYVQDDLQLTQKLTLNLGLRYEYRQPFLDKNGREYTFNPETQQLIVPDAKSLQLVSPLLSPVFKIVTAGEAGYPGRLVSFGNGNFAPRIGFAYRLTSETVVRGGYGVYYDFNPPYQANLGPYQPSESFPNNVITNGVPAYRFPNPFPSSPISGVGLGSLAITGSIPNMKVPYTQQWNFTVERQFAGNTSVRFSYIGTRTTQMQYIRNLNIPVPSTTPYSASRKPYTNFGVMSLLDQGGNALYQAFETYVKHRSKGGLSFTSSFDWAKSLSDVGAENGSSGAPSPLNPYSRAMDKGNVAWQPRLRSVTQVHWLVPFGEGRPYGSGMPTIAKWLLSGWEITDIFTISSGDFLTPSYAGYDSTGTSITGGRPDLIGDPKISNPTRDRWFNPAAFSVPGANPATPLVPPSSTPIGRFGNAGVGIFTGPGSWQNDVGLIRQFPIYERLKFNLFVFGTNIFNHINPANPNTAITTTQSVGRILSIRGDGNTSGIGPRQLTLGLRIEF
jgi:hypothetical protein